MMLEEKVILVNENDEPICEIDKMEVHRKSLLHRAFSVFIFNDSRKLLLQRRSKEKYHSSLLWTNTCCGHPRWGEDHVKSGERRLQEEMGFTTQLETVGSFIYKSQFENGLVEHEFDYLLKGFYNGVPYLNPEEVDDYKWMKIQDIRKDMKENPKDYTSWLHIIFEKYYDLLF